jgi:hypothetical protein
MITVYRFIEAFESAIDLLLLIGVGMVIGFIVGFWIGGILA